MATKLSETAVRALAATRPTKAVVTWCADSRGLGVKVAPVSRTNPDGLVTFVLRYRNRRGMQRLQTLGRWPDLSVPQARRIAEGVLAQVRLGADPCGERRADRVRGTTVAGVSVLYLNDPTLDLKASTRVDIARVFRLHIVPTIGRLELAALSSGDIRQMQVAVASGRTRADRKARSRGQGVARGGVGVAAKAVRYASMFLTWCVEGKYITTNPARGVTVPQTKVRTRVYTAGELARIASALAKVEAERPELRAQVDAIRLLALTGLRRSEATSLRWGDIDGAAGVVRLVDAKTGARTVSVGATVMTWLQQLPRAHPTWLFPHRDGKGPLTGVRVAWEAVRGEAGLTGEGLHAPVLHTFRHSAATAGIEGGVPGPMLQNLLGWRSANMVARYAHIQPHAAPARAAAAALAAPVADIFGIGDNIVPIAAGKRTTA